MIDFIRADHIHICVPPDRLEEAKDFYTGVIGFELTERPHHLFSSVGYWLRAGNIGLHIGIEPFTCRSSRHTAFQVQDVIAARKHLEHNNVEIVEEPLIPGRARFAFIDPFGNRMELLQLIDE